MNIRYIYSKPYNCAQIICIKNGYLRVYIFCIRFNQIRLIVKQIYLFT